MKFRSSFLLQKAAKLDKGKATPGKAKKFTFKAGILGDKLLTVTDLEAAGANKINVVKVALK